MIGFMMNIPDIKSDQERIKNKLLKPQQRSLKKIEQN